MNRIAIAGVCALLGALTFAPSAGAAFGDNFGITDVTGPDGVAAPAFPNPAGKAWWAGTCDLAAATPVVGAPPATFGHCIDQQSGAGAAVPPLAPGVALGTSGPAGWQGELPSWRLAPVAQAAAHPDASATFWFVRHPDRSQTLATTAQPDGSPRDVTVRIPPGVAGNPQALAMCPAGPNLRTVPVTCPPQSQVGVVTVNLGTHGTATFPVYNVEPRDGRTAEFIFSAGIDGYASNVPIVARARTEGDFGVDTAVIQIPTGFPVSGQTFTLWGVPWAAEHDRYRPPAGFAGTAVDLSTFAGAMGMPVTGLDGTPDHEGNPADPQSYRPSWGAVKSFFVNPTACAAQPPVTDLDVTSWHRPGAVLSYSAPADVPVDGCADVPFDPAIELEPTVQATDTPSGLDVALTIPQNDAELPIPTPPSNASQATLDQYVADATAHWKSDAGLATSHLEDTTVVLPEGMTVNPAGAHGQDACTSAEIGLTGADPVTFDNDDPADGTGHDCPPASQVGTVKVETPLLDPADWPAGEVYLAAQEDNPFGSLLALYIVVRSPERGFVAKIAGKVDPDPATGRLTTTFLNNPQLPFNRFELHFKGGPTAALATPATCGAPAATTDLAPWARPGSPVALATPIDLASGPSGSACPASEAARGLALGHSAGTADPLGGAHSRFSLRVTRPDGEQELADLGIRTPEGLTGDLSELTYCPDAALAAAGSRDGRVEQQSASCPAASLIGSTEVGAGAGPNPFYVAGKVYLAGPYRGAPLSVAVVVPAVAGPFDLGTVVVRAALHVNRRTAQISTDSDLLPQIREGIPLRVRDVRVDLDRPGFVLNPTDCDQASIDTQVEGSDGAAANLPSPYQATSCSRLAFAPKLAMRLTGRRQVRTGKHPGVRAQVTQAGIGEAGVEQAEVRLPRSLALDPDNAQALCEFADGTRDDLENHCPKGSIVGRARAVTPLLKDPLAGNVYFVKNVRRGSSGNLIRTLPMIVVALRGQIPINLIGTSSVEGGKLVSTFETVPDAPISRFNLNIAGGANGILAVTRTRRARIDLCASGRQIAEADFDGQNAKRHDLDVAIKKPCRKRPARLRVGPARWSGDKLSVRGRIAPTASRRLRVTVRCRGSKRSVSKGARSGMRGTWKATLTLGPRCGSARRARVIVRHAGGASVTRAVRRD